MQRKEVYATTGPRMVVRFFGGWAYQDADAKTRDMRQRSATVRACPWVGTSATAAGKAPTFLVGGDERPGGCQSRSRADC